MKSGLHIIQASVCCLSKLTLQKQVIQQNLQHYSERPTTIYLNIINFIIIFSKDYCAHSKGRMECKLH